jgi:hypothetical protein
VVVGLKLALAWQASFPNGSVVTVQVTGLPILPAKKPLNCTVPVGPGVGARFPVSTNAVRVVLCPGKTWNGFAVTVKELASLTVTACELEVEAV